MCEGYSRPARSRILSPMPKIEVIAGGRPGRKGRSRVRLGASPFASRSLSLLSREPAPREPAHLFSEPAHGSRGRSADVDDLLERLGQERGTGVARVDAARGARAR